MSMPAALGWVIVRAARDLPALTLRLRLRWAIGCSIISFGMWRRIGYVVMLSLKRDIGPAEANRQADSPMSMTPPRTTLTRGQYAPLLHRSSAAPHSTLPQRNHFVFLRRDLRLRADYFANQAIEGSVDLPRRSRRWKKVSLGEMRLYAHALRPRAVELGNHV
jgi:hypothetical protein